MLPVGLRVQNEGPKQYHPQREEHNTTSRTDEGSVRTFIGRITKNGDQYVLEDSSTNNSYVLDNQKQAKKFKGQNVTVTGRLGASNNSIHVQKIEKS